MNDAEEVQLYRTADELIQLAEARFKVHRLPNMTLLLDDGPVGVLSWSNNSSWLLADGQRLLERSRERKAQCLAHIPELFEKCKVEKETMLARLIGSVALMRTWCDQ